MFLRFGIILVLSCINQRDIKILEAIIMDFEIPGHLAQDKEKLKTLLSDRVTPQAAPWSAMVSQVRPAAGVWRGSK